MDQVDQFNTSSALNHNGQMFRSQDKDGLKQMGFEEKKAAVKEEMRRISQLPSNSTYVVHRSRVLNKIMQLLSIESMQLEKAPDNLSEKIATISLAANDIMYNNLYQLAQTQAVALTFSQKALNVFVAMCYTATSKSTRVDNFLLDKPDICI